MSGFFLFHFFPLIIIFLTIFTYASTMHIVMVIKKIY